MPDLDLNLTDEERLLIINRRLETKAKELRDSEAAAGVFDSENIHPGMSAEERTRCLDAIRRAYGKRS